MRFIIIVFLLCMTPFIASGEGIGCPKGTIPNGEKTPDGSEAWCELETNRSQYHGPYRAWYGNGALGTLENYDHGKREGKAEYRWENGKVQVTGQYKNGVRDGIWIFTENNGASAGRVEYREGKIVSGHEPTWATE
jgi:antitoxin component YwqK of YwqJK toxin-antitoxin module